MKNCRMLSLFVLSVLLVGFGSGSAFGAGKYPEKSITIIVQAGAGGGSDIFARTLAASAEKDKLLPQPMVVENKPGGSGGIAFAYVAGKKKDPYYLITAVTSFLTTPIMGLTPVSYKDFTPVANLAFDELVLMVNAKSKYKSVREIVDFAKANPQKVTVGGTQLGGSDSICTHLIEKAAGIKFNFIVFNGGGEVNAALLGGHVDIAFGNPCEALELYKAGKVNLLGVFAEKRMAAAPDIPTMKEQGLDAVLQSHRGLCAPAGIPADARKVLETALFQYTKTEIFKKYVADNMLTEAWMNGEAYGKALDEWNAKYTAVLREMGLVKKK